MFGLASSFLTMFLTAFAAEPVPSFDELKAKLELRNGRVQKLQPFSGQSGIIVSDPTSISVRLPFPLKAGDLLAFSQFKNIELVLITGANGIEGGLTGLKEWQSINRLFLNGVDNDSLSDLAGIKTITELWLSSSDVDDAGLLALAKLPRLRSLKIFDKTKVTQDGIAHLSAIKTLESLYVHGFPEGPEKLKGLEQISKLSGLRSLELEKWVLFDRVHWIVKLQKLESLALYSTGLYEKDWQQLAELPNLRSLTVMHQPLTPDKLKRISQIASLTSVRLNTSANDKQLACLANLTQLNSLHFDGGSFTGRGFESLQGLKNFESLTLFETHITDDALEAIAKLPALTRLEIVNYEHVAPKWSEAGLEQLRMAKPKLKIKVHQYLESDGKRPEPTNDG